MWVVLQSTWASLRTRPFSTDISRIDEESFILLEAEIETTFRGVKSAVKEGKTVHIPANAPHQFQNTSSRPARLLCICSPAGQEEFFAEVGVPDNSPLRSWTRQVKRSLERILKRWPRNIGQSYCGLPGLI